MLGEYLPRNQHEYDTDTSALHVEKGTTIAQAPTRWQADLPVI